MKTKEIKIKIPTDWSAVTLKKYLEIQSDLENYKDDENAIRAVLFSHFTNLSPYVLEKFDTEVIQDIKKTIDNFINKTDYPLQRQVKIGDVLYGIEPNLSKMSYGAYLDITSYDNLSIDKNWVNIIDILYRPVIEESGVLYNIQPYTGTKKENVSKWLELGMDFHFGVYFFFINLLMDLFQDTLNSLKKEEGIPHNIKSILEKSGKDIRQLYNLQKETSFISIKSSKNHSKNAYFTLRI